MPPVLGAAFKRRDLLKGLEPDECYYIEHAAAVLGKIRLDLAQDPPPDLVVEIDISHRALDREQIYAALGVAEVWRFDRERLEALVLQAGQTYRRQDRSRAFPWLDVAELDPFLRQAFSTDDTRLARRLREWVRQKR